MNSIRHSLDYNQLYSLQLDYDRAHHQLKVTYESSDGTDQRFADAIMKQLHLDRGATSEDVTRTRSKNEVTFANVNRQFTLRLGDEPIGTYMISATGELSMNTHRPLTIDETRRIGTFHYCPPYPMRREGLTAEKNDELFREAKTAVFTDFHTHSSGQISATGLLDVALDVTRKLHEKWVKEKKGKEEYKYKLFYPTDLLIEAGIDVSYTAVPKDNGLSKSDPAYERYRMDIPREPFAPLDRPGVQYPEKVEAIDLHYLFEHDHKQGPRNKALLTAQLSLGAHRQWTFSDVEKRCYYLRNPLAKDSRFIAPIRKREAEEFVNQGIEFALTSFVGIDKPHILNALHSAVEEQKYDPATKDFTQRFMAGIPRGLPLPMMKETLDKARILLDSPTIMGVDMLGYESNKTAEFIHLLDEYAAWANTHKPGSFIRVHAGENDKNHDNVKDFLKIAVNYPNLHFLVGHGVYGMDKETIRLLTQLGDRVTVELNPSSNIALNNADDVKQLPFSKLLANNIPFVLGSDSAGLYQTDAVQLGLAAYHGGLGLEGFQSLRENQTRLVHHMKEYSTRIEASIPHWDTAKGQTSWLNDMSKRIAQVPRAVVEKAPVVDEKAFETKLRNEQVSLIKDGEKYPPELRDKSCVTIIGASGTSWKRISREQRYENAIAIDMLIHALGDKSYIMQGRNKSDGLSRITNRARSDSDENRKATGQAELFNAGLHINPAIDDTRSYRQLTHLIRIPGQSLDLAKAIVDHTYDHDGVLIAVGGAAYTRDAILEADQRGSGQDGRNLMFLMTDAEGASAEKASVLNPKYQAKTGEELITKLFNQRPDFFPPNFNISKENLKQLREQSKKNVLGHPSQHVDNGSTVVAGPFLHIQTKQQVANKLQQG